MDVPFDDCFGARRPFPIKQVGADIAPAGVALMVACLEVMDVFRAARCRFLQDLVDIPALGQGLYQRLLEFRHVLDHGVTGVDGAGHALVENGFTVFSQGKERPILLDDGDGCSHSGGDNVICVDNIADMQLPQLTIC